MQLAAENIDEKIGKLPCLKEATWWIENMLISLVDPLIELLQERVA